MVRSNIFIRTEKHIISPSSKWFSMLDSFCYLSKNLYNHANYIIRQKFIGERLWIKYKDLDKILKHDKTYPDYSNMPTAQSAQQTLRLLDKNWKSFFKAIKDWKKNPSKYLGRPRLPKYKSKDDRFVLILTNQNCRYVDGKIVFPKVFKGMTVIPDFADLPTEENENKDSVKIFNSFQQIRFIPQGTYIVMEVIYTIKAVDLKENNGRYAGIDIGVNNLATMATNTSEPPMIIAGGPLKSINQYYNKKHAFRQSLCKLSSGRNTSHRLERFTKKRNRKINDYMHKASRLIVNECVCRNISVIVIGKNKNWKQNSRMSKKNNQTFVQLPFARLIQMIEYKAQEKGIAVVLTEESYTSGTSFLDNEPPTKEFYNRKRRIHRGLFRANNGKTINADVNGAMQILKKEFPDVSADGIEGVVLRPVIVISA